MTFWAIACVTVIVGLVVFIGIGLRAPVGREDASGFHHGEEAEGLDQSAAPHTAKLPDRPEDLRRAPAAVLAQMLEDAMV